MQLESVGETWKVRVKRNLGLAAVNNSWHSFAVLSFALKMAIICKSIWLYDDDNE